MSHARGLLSDEERDEWFTLADGVGLTVDHEKLDHTLLHESVAAIMKTRDGLQRFVLAGPYGKCLFANDIVSNVLKLRLNVCIVSDQHHFLIFHRAKKSLTACLTLTRPT